MAVRDPSTDKLDINPSIFIPVFFADLELPVYACVLPCQAYTAYAGLRTTHKAARNAKRPNRHLAINEQYIQKNDRSKWTRPVRDQAALALALASALALLASTTSGMMRVSTLRIILFVCSASESVRIVCGKIRARWGRKPL